MNTPDSNPTPLQARILIVDDDPAVGEVMGQVLEALGYSSACCGDPAEAISRFKEGGFDVILTDYRMPTMSGIELSQEMRKCQASIPVILMSGYSPEMEEGEMSLSPIDLILDKPIEMDRLDQAIKSSLLLSKSNEY